MSPKGPALSKAIEKLGVTVALNFNRDQFVVRRGSAEVAWFDTCEDAAFRYGQVGKTECLSWFEFHTELQAVLR